MSYRRDFWRRPPLWGGAAALAGALGAYAYLVETNALELTRTEVALPALPPALDGLTVLLIADTHVTHWGIRERRLLELLDTLPPPDLLLWGGDFIQGRVGIPEALRLIEAVRNRLPGVPAFGVPGNAEHKLWYKERERFVAQVEALGVTMLLNRWQSIPAGGAAFTLVGVDDPYYGHADLEAALRGAPESEVFTLLLSHSPQLAAQAAKAGVDLMVSGHTHGGQVRLPLIGPLKTQNPLCFRLDMGLFPPEKLARTLGYDPGGRLTTYITRGVGVALVPRIGLMAPRFLCRPEVSLLTLRSVGE